MKSISPATKPKRQPAEPGRGLAWARKLTDRQVEELVGLAKTGRYKQVHLALKFGVTEGTVSRYLARHDARGRGGSLTERVEELHRKGKTPLQIQGILNLTAKQVVNALSRIRGKQSGGKTPRSG